MSSLVQNSFYRLNSLIVCWDFTFIINYPFIFQLIDVVEEKDKVAAIDNRKLVETENRIIDYNESSYFIHDLSYIFSNLFFSLFIIHIIIISSNMQSNLYSTYYFKVHPGKYVLTR